MRAFEACAAEIAHPSTSAKKDQQVLWMGSFLKPGKTSHTRATYFKPEGAVSTFFPAKVNANLAELSDGLLKDKHSIPISWSSQCFSIDASYKAQNSKSAEFCQVSAEGIFFRSHNPSYEYVQVKAGIYDKFVLFVLDERRCFRPLADRIPTSY